MKKLLIILLSLAFIGGAQAQKKGHKITFHFNDFTNGDMLIAYHYNGKQFISDTLKVDDKGDAVLTGDQPLDAGVYLAVFPHMKNQYFEFLVNEQHFGITTSTKSMIKDIEFQNSKENEIFYDDMVKMNDLRAQSKRIEEQLKTAKGDDKLRLEEKLNGISSRFKEDRLKLMKDNADFLYTDLLGLLKETEFPKDIEEEDKYRYFKKHYWDNTDFGQPGIIRTPVFHNKMMEYVGKYSSPVPDSIMVSCDDVLIRALPNDKIFQTCLVTLLNKYANSKVMGHDAVYVHLVENYYLNGKAYWADSAQLAKLEERALAIAPLLIGRTAPDLALRDTTTKAKYQLSQMPNEYTVLYIWDPECGHCKKATPKLGEFYKAHKTEDIGVYAISTTNIYELDKWTEFIRKHDLDWVNVADLYNETKFRDSYDLSSTPQVYVLDNNQEIIAKRLGVEQLETFFHNYLKGKDDKRYKKFSNEPPVPIEHDEHDGEDHSGHGH